MNSNKNQALLGISCYFLEIYDQTKRPFLKNCGLNKKDLKKMDKAFDLIAEVNAECAQRIKKV